MEGEVAKAIYVLICEVLYYHIIEKRQGQFYESGKAYKERFGMTV